MENDPFIDGLPIKNGDFPYVTNNQRVSGHKLLVHRNVIRFEVGMLIVY